MPIPLRFFCSVLLSAGLFLNNSQPPKPTVTVDDSLPARRWVLRTVEGRRLPATLASGPVTSLMLRSATDQAYALSTGCAGTFTPTLGTQLLAFTQVIKTLIKFDNVAMTTEFRYLTALAQARRYELKGATLCLFDTTHIAPSLTFEALP